MEKFNQNSALLLKTAIDTGITDPEELGCIMGNASVETGKFSTMHEDFRYRSVDKLLDNVKSATKRYTRQEIQAALDSKDPARVATVMYEGRNTGKNGLGNSEPGDGWRFHGRGFFQYTGRENYTKFGKLFDVDLASNPEIAAEPAMAAKLAIAYWKQKVPEHSRRDAVASGMKINGGDNGEFARFAASDRWKKTITPELVQDIQTGKITLDQLSFHGWDALKDGKLKPNERGMEIRELQHHLNALGIADARGRALDPNGTFDRPTQQAAETFHRQLGMPANSPATANTLKAAEFYAGAPEILRKPLQPVQESSLPETFHDPRHHIPSGAPPSYRNDWLERDAQGLPNYLHTPHAHERSTSASLSAPGSPMRSPALETPSFSEFAASNPTETRLLQLQQELDALRRQVQHDGPHREAGPAPHHDADPHPGARSAAMSAPSRSGPERKSEPESVQPQPYSPHDAQAFPSGHRDYALFEAIRQQLPDEYSDDMVAHATLEARKGGITRPDQIRGMAIENGQLTIMGKSGVDFAFIELTASAPPLQETLQQSAAFDQQQAIQLAQFQEQQRQINQNQSGPTMRL